ncbi:MAG: DUF4382 domain-containing protein [Chloroflexi bacterium]|nr:DUF4382 domain-containing protein [Chloroflexota bacterium]
MKRMKFSPKFLALVMVIALTFLAACAATPPTTQPSVPNSTPTSKPGATPGAPAPSSTSTPTTTPATPAGAVGKGTLEVRVSDPPPPAPIIDHVWVSVQNLEVHRTGGEWTAISVNATAFDLKAIQGIEQFLGSQIVESGNYTQVRLEVKSVTIEAGGKKIDATVPGDRIRLVGGFEVVPNRTTVITIDFDGEKSVVMTGEGKYHFKPVVKLLVSRPDGGKAAAAPGTATGNPSRR